MDTSDYNNLGCMNAWYYGGKNNPPEYDECIAKGHQHRAVSSATWRCYTYYYCDICKIKYEVDSSD